LKSGVRGVLATLGHFGGCAFISQTPESIQFRLKTSIEAVFFFEAVFFEASFIVRPPAVSRSMSTLFCEAYVSTLSCGFFFEAVVFEAYPLKLEI
jgi:hypothetical protein